MTSEDQLDGEGAQAVEDGVIWRRLATLYSGSTVLFWPFTDLAVRFFVAQYYFRSGLVKASNWDTAVALAANEYPVSWMAPVHAAATGLTIELVGPILLFLGLFTRPAALALAALTVISQAVYIPTTTNLMLVAMSIWYVFCGPSALSMDRIWAATHKIGSRRPIKALLSFGAWVRKLATPLLLLGLRVWLGLALLSLAGMFEPSVALATWLPTNSFSGTPDWLAMTFVALFFLGLAATLLSYALTFLIGYFMLAGAHPDVTFYPVLLLAIYEARGAGFLSLDPLIESRLANWLGKDAAPRDDDESAGVILVIFAGSLWHFFSRKLRVFSLNKAS